VNPVTTTATAAAGSYGAVARNELAGLLPQLVAAGFEDTRPDTEGALAAYGPAATVGLGLAINAH
jgi:hypothetical protein